MHVYMCKKREWCAYKRSTNHDQIHIVQPIQYTTGYIYTLSRLWRCRLWSSLMLQFNWGVARAIRKWSLTVCTLLDSWPGSLSASSSSLDFGRKFLWRNICVVEYSSFWVQNIPHHHVCVCVCACVCVCMCVCVYSALTLTLTFLFHTLSLTLPPSLLPLM